MTGERTPRRVLIADDSRTMRLAIGRTLAEGGYHVHAVQDGNELREALARPDAPRLVVSDWNMPGPTGVEICRELRARPEGDRFYFLVVTANAEPEHLLEALEAGADDFIRKPFSAPELLARVHAGRRMADLHEGLESTIAELRAALAEVKTLRGLIPICMHCHRVRVGDDDWERIESYLESHSEAELSHGLCAECLERYYPEGGENAA